MLNGQSYARVKALITCFVHSVGRSEHYNGKDFNLLFSLILSSIVKSTLHKHLLDLILELDREVYAFEVLFSVGIYLYKLSQMFSMFMFWPE